MARKPWLLIDQPPPVAGSTVLLDSGESHHAAGVLRLEHGDPVILADGAGHLADAVLRSVDRRGVEAEIVDVHVIGRPVSANLMLALAVLHSQAMDWAVQKAVEVGAQTLVPVLTERSQLGRGSARRRLGRWRRIARQALKQCRRPWQMDVVEPTPLDRLVDESQHRIGAVADPDGGALAELAGVVPDLLLVGPEGGFGEHDEEVIEATGWSRLTLGRHVLRADTAAVVGAAMLIAAHESAESSGGS